MSRKNQPSSIDRLPEEIRERIAQLRTNGRTINEILEALNSLLPEDEVPSRSALGRHLKDWDAVSNRVRESRMMAQALSRDFGDKVTSDVARANMELLHSACLRMLASTDDMGEAVQFSAKELAALASAIEKTTKASKVDFDQQLAAAKELERRETLEKVAAAVEETGKQRGISPEHINAIKAGVLGIEA